MDNLSPHYIIDHDGNKTSVILSIEAYQRMLAYIEAIDDEDDVRLYDEAMAEDDGTRIPFEEAFQLIDTERVKKKSA